MHHVQSVRRHACAWSHALTDYNWDPSTCVLRLLHVVICSLPDLITLYIIDASIWAHLYAACKQGWPTN
jgi:hypothetical protein